MKFIKYLLLFLLIYLDPFLIGGFKWAQIWKIIILVILFFYFSINNYKYNKFVSIYFFLAISSLINASIFESFIGEFGIFIKNLILPFILVFWINSKSNPNKFIKDFSVFIILSGIPFIFKLIPQLGGQYDLEIFGASLNIFSYTGLFQNPHAASIITAYATIVCFNFFKKSQKKGEKYFMLIVFIIGLILSVKTFVRTGLAMTIVGLLSNAIYGKSLTKILKFSPLFIVISVMLITYVSSNELLLNRLVGVNMYQTTMDINTISSGRLGIWESSLKSYTKNNNPIELFFGLGENLLKKRNKQEVGREFVTHNGFLDMLITNGVLGLVIYILFVKKWYYSLKNKAKLINSKNIHVRISISIFFMYLTFMMLQGGPLTYDSIFIAYSIITVSSNLKKTAT
jgi:hypothetical protein